eukprot:TRINITY_DN781993_c0_g1_i1.p1 TRINITY_DN781993_c0_g1~~TRINITY_DN781993_c0_g1_i1.p1  ORF type:complete len:116 (-),score=6.25 TRINITY_DN781993_c0_g1_i1:151-498(-)
MCNPFSQTVCAVFCGIATIMLTIIGYMCEEQPQFMKEVTEADEKSLSVYIAAAIYFLFMMVFLYLLFGKQMFGSRVPMIKRRQSIEMQNIREPLLRRGLNEAIDDEDEDEYRIDS